jgi:transcription antitermination factor NusG
MPQGEVGCGQHGGETLPISKPRHGGPRKNSGGRRQGAGRKPAKLQLPPIEFHSYWAVYETWPEAEMRAARRITEQGYTGYLPLTAEPLAPTARGVIEKIRVPLFPCYGFVFLGPDDRWAPIRRLTGIRDLILTAAGKPGAVQPGFVEKLIAQEDERCCLAPERMAPYAPAALVRIEGNGPLAGHEGRVVRCNGMTTTVEVTLFGRVVPAKCERRHVVAIRVPSAPAAFAP